MRLSSDKAYFFFFRSLIVNFKNLLTLSIILEVYVKNETRHCTSSFTESSVKGTKSPLDLEQKKQLDFILIAFIVNCNMSISSKVN
jgi:hypothetical protein